MEKKKSRCMALDCCCYFIPASALLFGFYQPNGCCWGENRFFDRDDAQIIPQYENLAKACAEAASYGGFSWMQQAYRTSSGIS